MFGFFLSIRIYLKKYRKFVTSPQLCKLLLFHVARKYKIYKVRVKSLILIELSCELN